MTQAKDITVRGTRNTRRSCIPVAGRVGVRFPLRFLPLLCLLVSAASAWAQPPVSADSLGQEAFLDIVRAYHPVARQSNLLLDRARAELTLARAGFDPYFGLHSERKVFDGKTYYNRVNPELKVPAWYGVELYTGTERNLGGLQNPELTTGQSSYLGMSVPLAKNLLMDKRRAVLRQAQIFRESSKAERSLMLNDLLYDAVRDYWEWTRSFLVFGVLEEAVAVSQARLGLVRQSHLLGDRPAIDTTEALAQLQAFQLSRNEAWLEYRKAGLALSNHLWRADGSPYELPASVVPDTAWVAAGVEAGGLPVLEELLSLSAREHPKLQVYGFKLRSLEVERRLKFQELLPMVNMKYNLLNSGYDVFKDASASLYANNYRFGLDIGIPLRLSRGRGEYRLAGIKISEAKLDLSMDRLGIENKVRYHFNELALVRTQVRLAGEALSSQERLLRGEEARFRNGESSMFLVNSRASKVLETRQKLAELRVKRMLAEMSLRWAAGQLR